MQHKQSCEPAHRMTSPQPTTMQSPQTMSCAAALLYRPSGPYNGLEELGHATLFRPPRPLFKQSCVRLQQLRVQLERPKGASSPGPDALRPQQNTAR